LTLREQARRIALACDVPVRPKSGRRPGAHHFGARSREHLTRIEEDLRPVGDAGKFSVIILAFCAERSNALVNDDGGEQWGTGSVALRRESAERPV
jgi:hypothetical protein